MLSIALSPALAVPVPCVLDPQRILIYHHSALSVQVDSSQPLPKLDVVLPALGCSAVQHY